MMEEQLVVFELSDEAYGVGVDRVQSILQMQEITHVPRAPRFIEGVINLRGAVIPVVDLRSRFEFSPPPEGQKQVIIIVELGEQQIGMIVDKVTEVTKVPNEAIEPPSPLLSSVDTTYLRGIARMEEKLVILLDLDRVFSLEEQQALREQGEESEDDVA